MRGGAGVWYFTWLPTALGPAWFFACAALVLSVLLWRWPFLELFAFAALFGCALTGLAFP
jgi:hypothetical protein